MTIRRFPLLLIVLAPTVAAAHEGSPLRVLFFGNSFTHGYGSTRSVDELFLDVATAAGHPEPYVRSAAVSSRDLRWHAKNNTAAIDSLADGQSAWSHVVMQEHSTKLTQAYPDEPRYPESIENSKSTAVQLHEAVAGHSPSVTPVLYETWARGPGHEWYVGTAPLFSGPSDMQAVVRSGYHKLQRALNKAADKKVALIAPVGDAWERANYKALHSSDNWHAQNRGTLLAALVIYGVIYEDSDTSSIDLSGVLSSLDLGAEDGEQLTAAADQTLERAYSAEPAAALSSDR